MKEGPHPALPRGTGRGRNARGLCAGAFAVEDGQVAVGHLEDDQGEGGGVLVGDVAGPAAGGAVLSCDELVADGGVPLGPVVATGEEHGLDGVVVAVEVVAFGVGHSAS